MPDITGRPSTMRIAAIDSFTLRVPTPRSIALDFPEHRLVGA
jgi:hypothetical protein